MFPLATLWTEAEIVRERLTDLMGTEATLIKAAVVDVVAGENTLGEVLEELRGE